MYAALTRGGRSVSAPTDDPVPASSAPAPGFREDNEPMEPGPYDSLDMSRNPRFAAFRTVLVHGIGCCATFFANGTAAAISRKPVTWCSMKGESSTAVKLRSTCRATPNLMHSARVKCNKSRVARHPRLLGCGNVRWFKNAAFGGGLTECAPTDGPPPHPALQRPDSAGTWERIAWAQFRR